MNISFQSPPGGDPTISNGLKVSYPPAKRIFPRWRWGAILLLALSPMLLFAGHALWSALRIEGQGFLTSATREVCAPQDIRLDSVWVRPGQRVDSGQRLALWSSLAQEIMATAPAAPASLPLDCSGFLERERLSREGLALAQAQEERMRWLMSQGAATDAEWRSARAATLQAQGEATSRHQEWERCKQTPVAIPATPVPTGPPVDRVLRAPHAGIVLSVPGVERPLRRDEALITLQDLPQHWSVQAYLDPQHLSSLQVGHAATVRLPDGTGLSARILRTSATTDSARLGNWEMLRWNRRLLVFEMALQDSLPADARIQGLPVTAEFWRFLP